MTNQENHDESPHDYFYKKCIFWSPHSSIWSFCSSVVSLGWVAYKAGHLSLSQRKPKVWVALHLLPQVWLWQVITMLPHRQGHCSLGLVPPTVPTHSFSIQRQWVSWRAWDTKGKGRLFRSCCVILYTLKCGDHVAYLESLRTSRVREVGQAAPVGNGKARSFQCPAPTRTVCLLWDTCRPWIFPSSPEIRSTCL